MSLTATFRSIGIDRDYSALDIDLPADLQGWGSYNPIFERVLREFRPSVVIEVGTWKGASVINMAQQATRMGLPTEFICVDTWLGSNDELWLNADYRKSLMLRGGYPSMFRQFVANLHHGNVADRVFPLPMTSSSAYHLLKALNVRADAIYIDAGHELEEVYIDLKLYYDLLRPGGALFGDDYHERWQGVIDAVARFAGEEKLEIEVSGSKFLLKKHG